MERAVIYIHGQGGNALEARHYQPLFPDSEVIGFDYRAQTPWEAADEFPRFFAEVGARYRRVSLIANSIGAYFAVSAPIAPYIDRAYFISPVADMENLITAMMREARVSEETLRERGEIDLSSGQRLSWAYLTYVREHPIAWRVPTRILYGGNDRLISRETVTAFAQKIGATLTVMEDGEHWFHAEEQMRFLDRWITGAE